MATQSQLRDLEPNDDKQDSSVEDEGLGTREADEPFFAGKDGAPDIEAVHSADEDDLRDRATGSQVARDPVVGTRD